MMVFHNLFLQKQSLRQYLEKLIAFLYISFCDYKNHNAHNRDVVNTNLFIKI